MTQAPYLAFASPGLTELDLRLDGVAGHEQISHFYEIDALLSAPEGPLTAAEIDALLLSPCLLALGATEEDVVHGLVESVEELDTGDDQDARYLVRVVPNMWLLTLSKGSRVFQGLTLAGLIEQVLGGYQLRAGADFDLRITKGGPPREYVVQYQESDFQFLERWLERSGVFYWFEHRREGEILRVADENADATRIDEPIAYRGRHNLREDGVTTIWDFRCRARRRPAHVVLADYNYRTPHVALVAHEVVDAERGFGVVFDYGEHFKDVDEGKAIAGLRAERLRSEQRTFAGKTDSPRVRVGHTFTLSGHPVEGYDGEYLVTALDYRAGRAIRGDKANSGASPYEATFTAIPKGVPYRPEMSTPTPRIHAVINAHVEADTDGALSQMDDQGRYKVRLPFDLAGAEGTKASRWVRMAQPYSGSGYGFSFPLHKGAEVLLAHVGGDPDRPVILAAIPNAHSVGPSTAKNASQSVIKTASGIRIEMEDNQS